MRPGQANPFDAAHAARDQRIEAGSLDRNRPARLDAGIVRCKARKARKQRRIGATEAERDDACRQRLRRLDPEHRRFHGLTVGREQHDVTDIVGRQHPAAGGFQPGDRHRPGKGTGRHGALQVDAAGISAGLPVVDAQNDHGSRREL